MKEFHSQKYNLEKGWQALLKDLNISVQDVLRYTQLPSDLLLRKTPAVTANEYYRFWDGLAHASKNEPALALRLAKTISANTIAPAIIAFLSSSNLNLALKRIAHYKPIVAPVRMYTEQNDRQTILTFAGLPPNGSLPTLFVAFELVFWVELARMATREKVIPVTVHSSLDLPELDVYETFWRHVSGVMRLTELQLYLNPNAEHTLDWFHITMRITVMCQMARGLGPPVNSENRC
jgi:hypothetical protein